MKIDPGDPKTYKDLPWTTAITRPKRKRICQVQEDFDIAGTKGRAGDYIVLNPKPQQLKKELLPRYFQVPGEKESILTSTAVRPEDYEFVFETPDVVAYKNEEEFILIAVEDFGKEGIEPIMRMKASVGLETLLHVCRKKAEATPGEKHLSSLIASIGRKRRVGKLRHAEAPFT